MPKDQQTDPVTDSYRVPFDDGPFDLGKLDPRDKACFPEREMAEIETASDSARIDLLQDILYAQGKHALLIVLQAMDTGGKDGVVRKVFGPVEPLGVRVKSFKAPTEEERDHDFLWRIHRDVPRRGMIGIFNRSHYEDVLIARVKELAPPAEIEARYDQINLFERHLAETGTTILKFYLHISKAEQKERLQARLDEPTKHWKFNIGDLAERARWPKYMEAYEIALGRCSKPWAPWFVVPADRKWHRNAVIARIVRQTLESLDLQYPDPEPGLDQVVIE